MPYLNVDEVESALTLAAESPNNSIAQLLTLPNKTWENRTCHAIKLASDSGANRTGAYFLGGIHAREWGSCDILIGFIQVLEHAFLNNDGITLGGKSFSAADVQNIVNTLDLFVFPQANPDGRNWSMTRDPMWRKNRRPAPAGDSNSDCVGVDLNRNFDFLWDYPNHFAPTAPIQNSTDPCDPEVYIGPGAFSEPEARNVKWILDQHPGIRFFIDLHSYGELLMYTWGDAADQSSTPSMNFLNPVFDAKRGLKGAGAYKEFIATADKNLVLGLARRMQSAIRAVRGTRYSVQQDFAMYPTAGASDDYASSRHFVDASLPRVHAFTIEWGRKEFQPPFSEMQHIMQEINAALLDFCLGVIATPLPAAAPHQAVAAR